MNVKNPYIPSLCSFFIEPHEFSHTPLTPTRFAPNTVARKWRQRLLIEQGEAEAPDL